MRQDWEKQELGWYTKSGVGGIVHEADGCWWFYPLLIPEMHGPYPSLKRAMIAAEGVVSDLHRM